MPEDNPNDPGTEDKDSLTLDQIRGVVGEVLSEKLDTLPERKVEIDDSLFDSLVDRVTKNVVDNIPAGEKVDQDALVARITKAIAGNAPSGGGNGNGEKQGGWLSRILNS